MPASEKNLLEQLELLKQKNELLEKKIAELHQSRQVNEETLRESEERLTMALEANSEGIWDWDIRSGHVYIDSRMFHVLGYPPDAFPNTFDQWRTRFHPEDYQLMQRRLIDHLKGKIEPFECETRVRTQQGSWLWLLCRGKIVEKSRDNRAARVIGTFTDITTQKEALQALAESEERFRILQEASFGGIGIHEKGVILDANQGLSTLTGFQYDELIGMNGLLLIDESTREMVMHNIVSGYEKPYDAVGIRKDGSTYPLEIQGKNIPYHGRTVRVTEFRDITERKKAEDALRESEKRLIQFQKMEAIGTLAGGVAHDFNNLLGGILGNVSLLKMHLPPDTIPHKKVVTIEKIVQRGTNLARQLLGFARGGKYQVTPVNLNVLIQDILEMFGRTCKNIQIHTTLQNDLWTIEGDRTQLEQVLLNLLINAADAMPDGGEIHIATRNMVISEIASNPHLAAPGNYTSITVRDTGTGMDPETRSKVFDPFFTTKEQGKGTGLGLSSAYGIIKNHNGHIEVYSESNHGAAFIITLPASEKKIDAAGKTTLQLKTGTETILLVDDENDFRDAGNEMLQTMGYRTITAENGKRAVDIFSTNPDAIDLVILDMIMPHMGGGETFDLLKQIKPDIKVLLCSGYSSDSEAANILSRGCNGFIQKPFDIIELSHTVREIIDAVVC